MWPKVAGRRANVNTKCFYGAWCMVHGSWFMVHGAWFMGKLPKLSKNGYEL